MRILLVEDAEDLGHAVARHLTRAGHAVDWARDGGDGGHLLASADYDAVLLDLSLPGVSGTDLLARLRAAGRREPVIVLTARGDMDDKLRHFQLGADDYLVKPFDLRELDARLEALQRRRHGLGAGPLVLGNMAFDAGGRRVSVDDRLVDLSAREYRLLEYFVHGRGRILSKEQILDQLFNLDGESGHNAVELSVSRLRRKLEGSTFEIRTIRGLGYVAEVRRD
ncbi:response regulator transcription factor [Chthonobacter rhizosphaerae]|uniref:response regulator transcription factor n=1 Tax=Chthonobacter rhizosphaerae TaxID=2735553 RepID=UPI0015EE3A6A|nr:response regulator transcription factor [Chthonobacter rhizosphaerae]